MHALYSPGFTLRTLLVICALCVVSLLYIPISIIDDLAAIYGTSERLAAGVITFFSFSYAIGFLIFGPLSDRLGRVKVISWGLVALSAITLLLNLTDSIFVLLAGRALQGLIAATFTPVAIAYLSERGTPQQRSWSVAWISTAFLSAGLLGQIYGETVVRTLGMSRGAVPLVCVYLLTALGLSLTPADTPQTVSLSLAERFRSAGQVLRNPWLQRIYFIAFILLMCFVSFYMTLNFHAVKILAGFGVTAFTVSVFSLPAFLMTLLAPYLLKIFNPEKVIAAGLVLSIAGTLASILGLSAGFYSLIIGSLLFVAGISIIVPGLIASIAAETDIEYRGLAVSFYTFVLFLGASLGPLLAQSTRNLSAPLSLSVQAIIMFVAFVYLTLNKK